MASSIEGGARPSQRTAASTPPVSAKRAAAHCQTPAEAVAVLGGKPGDSFEIEKAFMLKSRRQLERLKEAAGPKLSEGWQHNLSFDAPEWKKAGWKVRLRRVEETGAIILTFKNEKVSFGAESYFVMREPESKPGEIPENLWEKLKSGEESIARWAAQTWERHADGLALPEGLSFDALKPAATTYSTYREEFAVAEGSPHVAVFDTTFYMADEQNLPDPKASPKKVGLPVDYRLESEVKTFDEVGPAARATAELFQRADVKMRQAARGKRSTHRKLERRGLQGPDIPLPPAQVPNAIACHPEGGEAAQDDRLGREAHGGVDVYDGHLARGPSPTIATRASGEAAQAPAHQEPLGPEAHGVVRMIDGAPARGRGPVPEVVGRGKLARRAPREPAPTFDAPPLIRSDGRDVRRF